MLKPLNIRSFLQASESLSEENFKKFITYYDIDIRNAEIDDLGSLVEVLDDRGCPAGALDRFYLGYKIPQIGKEFDLLRFGPKSIVNIEIKRKCSEEKALKQLLRNQYYLSFIGRKIHAFTYVAESDDFYYLNKDRDLEKVSAEFLLEILKAQPFGNENDPDQLFDPSDYLVSPFNSTQKFLDDQYFLTNQQEDVKTQIFDSLQKHDDAIFISIIGSAGTGKTLLTYDIAKNLINEGKRVLIIHCGQLNQGHLNLIDEGWEITAIKYYGKYDLSKYNLVVVDEAQRIYVKQLNNIAEQAKEEKFACIFSHDKLQTLNASEGLREISAKIGELDPVQEYKLSEKIRTNKEIATFIKMLFSNKRSVQVKNNGNIEINYFSTTQDAKNYLDALEVADWKVLRFTPSQYNAEHHKKYSDASFETSHQVIGQEFDGVAVVIDQFFTYNEDGNLIYRGHVYYEPTKMLFQNITRSRKKLNIVIVHNQELLNRCIEILG